MRIRRLLTLAVLTGPLLSLGTPAVAQNEDCNYSTDVEIKMLSAAFEAWKSLADTMRNCAPNLRAEFDQQFREKQPTAFSANPALYHVGGVSNGTITPLIGANTIRPLDDLVEQYGQDLNPNQLIRMDGKIMAIAMMVNVHHLMYRQDIFDDLGIEPPANYGEFLEAAKTIADADVVDHPVGATYQTGWNLAMEFLNLYVGKGGELFDGANAAIDNDIGVATLEDMKSTLEFMDPEWAASDVTYVQQQMQQGEIAMTNFWHSRAGALLDQEESEVVDQVASAIAPLGAEGAAPVSFTWWDGAVIAKNIPDDEAEAAFRALVEAFAPQTVEAAPDVAVWLLPGYEPGKMAEGAIATLQAGAQSYPSTPEIGLLHTAVGNNIADFLTGANDNAEAVLADTVGEYTQSARNQGLLQ